MRIWNNGNTHKLLFGVQNGTTMMKDSLMISYITKYIFTIRFCTPIPRYLPRVGEIRGPYKNLLSLSLFGQIANVISSKIPSLFLASIDMAE